MLIRRILLLLIFASSAFAVDWEARYTEVCATDREFCGRVKSSDGTWLKIKPEIALLLKDPDVQKEINMAAAKYNVSPTAISGAIAAENSLNVGVTDSVQNFLAKKMGITKIGNRNFSVGLGQINMAAAMEAEMHTAKVEGRVPRTIDEVQKDIIEPGGSIRMAAQIVRKVQDDYKDQGIDISNKPEILATLYNLGKSEERAKKSKATGSLPKPNYFGFFVEKNKEEIDGFAKAAQDTSAGRVVAAKIAATKGNLSKEIGSSAPMMTKNFREVASSNLTLAAAPDSCPEAQYGQNIKEQISGLTPGSPSGILEKKRSFTVLSSKFGCNSTPWVLVRSENGAEGWIKKDTLETNKEKALTSITQCSTSKADSACTSSLEKATKDLKLESKEGLLYLKPKSVSDKVGFDQEDFYCKDRRKQDKDAAASNNNGWVNTGWGYGVQIPKSPLKSVQEQIKSAENISKAVDEKILEMSRVTGLRIGELGAPQNPYSQAYRGLKIRADQVSECIANAQTEAPSCAEVKANEDEILQTINDLKIQKNPNLNDVAMMSRKLVPNTMMYTNGTVTYSFGQQGMSMTADFYAPSDEELLSLNRNEIEDALHSCETRYNGLIEKAKVQMKELQNTYVSNSTVIPNAKNPTPGRSPAPPSGGGNPSTADGIGKDIGGGGGILGGGGGMLGSKPQAGGTSSGGGNMTATVYSGFYAKYAPGDQFSMTGLVKATKELNEADFEAKKYNLITMGKFCAARFNAVEGVKSKKPIECAQTPKFISTMSSMGAISSEIYAENNKKNPYFFYNDVTGKLMMYAQGMGQKPPPNPYQNGGGQAPVINEQSSFCPNVTAEYIEGLLKDHPCISRVYTPSPFITKKLSNHGSKVLLREFEGNDRYAIEISGGVSCEK